MANDPVEVRVVFQTHGQEDTGYYVWEVAAEDEGYVSFSAERPTAAELRAICSEYVEVP